SRRRHTRSYGDWSSDVCSSDLPYDFGATRVAWLALLTLIALSGFGSGGVVITKFSGHADTLQSSPTVFAETPTSGSASTRILFEIGRASCREGVWIVVRR